jgi:DNA (cytosine-5)-methyltransferase 1
MAENVKGLLTMDRGKIIDAMIGAFSSLGYKVKYELFNVKCFGVPQDRERVVIVGIRKDMLFDFHFPMPTHGLKQPYVTLRQAIGNLPEPSENDVYNSGFSSRYMSRNRIRSWNDVSFTIPAMARQVPLHPSSDPMKKVETDKWIFMGSKHRRFSWQECATIQSFPRTLKFSGSLVDKYKQIGNAVPPLFAQKIAESIIPLFDAG